MKDSYLSGATLFQHGIYTGLIRFYAPGTRLANMDDIFKHS